MIADILIVLAWLAFILVPVLVACRQPLEPGDGYFERYFEGPVTEGKAAESAVPSPED